MATQLSCDVIFHPTPSPRLRLKSLVSVITHKYMPFRHLSLRYHDLDVNTGKWSRSKLAVNFAHSRQSTTPPPPTGAYGRLGLSWIIRLCEARGSIEMATRPACSVLVSGRQRHHPLRTAFKPPALLPQPQSLSECSTVLSAKAPERRGGGQDHNTNVHVCGFFPVAYQHISLLALTR
jgi:hypothetical protein